MTFKSYLITILILINPLILTAQGSESCKVSRLREILSGFIAKRVEHSLNRDIPVDMSVEGIDYRVQSVLGESTAEVLKAERLSDGKNVAIKLYKKSNTDIVGEMQAMYERWVTEYLIENGFPVVPVINGPSDFPWEGVNHQIIIKEYEEGITAQELFWNSENGLSAHLIEQGYSVDQLRSDYNKLVKDLRGAFREGKFARWLHGKGYTFPAVHPTILRLINQGDIESKPGNFILTKEGQWKVLDP